MNAPTQAGAIFETRLRTRGYEIDPDGLIRPALYLRFCEHARWAALSAAGEVDQLFSGGGSMVVVAQRLALARDVGYDTELTVSFAAGGVGRTSVDFHQQLSISSSGEVVAAARITAVYLGPDGRPAPVPELLKRRQLPGDQAALALEVPEALEASDPARRTVLARELTVRPSDADLLGHVNHARHADYLDDGRLLAARDVGWLGGRLRGLAIEYVKEARPGDRLRTLTWPIDEAAGEVDCALVRVEDETLVSRGRLLVSRE